MITDILGKLDSGIALSEAEMVAVMTTIMEGQEKDENIAHFLNCLSQRGETAEEITGAARVLRGKALPIRAPANAVDCCGTGGDMSGTYNISTAVAIVAASCGVTIAKHGNRSSSSKSGAADVLEALGVNLDAPWEKLEAALQRFNFAFLMAPRHHHAMKHVAGVRKSLGVRTIFNLLGPLANPAGTKRQLLGVYDKRWLLPMAKALQKLGSERAWVVHGSDGLDEITVTGQTQIAKLENGQIALDTVLPDDFGLTISAPASLKGGNPQENAAALRALLNGEKGAYRDIVLANTAAVLLIADKASDLKTAAQKAAHAIDSKQAIQLLEDYIQFTGAA